MTALGRRPRRKIAMTLPLTTWSPPGTGRALRWSTWSQKAEGG